METQNHNPQGNASLEGAEFTWKYYDGFYTKTISLQRLQVHGLQRQSLKLTATEQSTTSQLADTYKVSGDSFYTQDGKKVLPLGTLTVRKQKHQTAIC